MAAEGSGSGSMPEERPGSMPEEGSSSIPVSGSGSMPVEVSGSGSSSIPVSGSGSMPAEASGSASSSMAGEASGSGTGRRHTRGRQRIPMQLIQHQDDLYASFSKRRQGIYKKATELCTLCDVDIGIVMSSPTGLPYSFFHPNMDSVVYRSMHPDQPQPEADRAVDLHMQRMVREMNQNLDWINESNDAETARFLRAMEEIEKRKTWMRQRLTTLSNEQLMVWRAWFKEYKIRVERRTEQIRHQIEMAAAEATPPPPLPEPESGENMEDLAGGSGAGGGVGQFNSPGLTSNDPGFGAGLASSSQFLFPPTPQVEGQDLFGGGGAADLPGPSVDSLQDLNLGAPGGVHRFYVPPPPPPGLYEAVGSGDVPEFYVPLQPGDSAGASGAGQFYYSVPPPPPNLDEAGSSGTQFYYPQLTPAANQDEAGPSGGQSYYPLPPLPGQDEAGPSGSQFYYPSLPNRDEAAPSGSQIYDLGSSSEDEDGSSGSQFYYPSPPNEDEAGPYGDQFYYPTAPNEDGAGPSNQKGDDA